MGWRTFSLFAIPLRERGVFYEAVGDMGVMCKSSLSLSIATTVSFLFITHKALSGACWNAI